MAKKRAKVSTRKSASASVSVKPVQRPASRPVAYSFTDGHLVRQYRGSK